MNRNHSFIFVEVVALIPRFAVNNLSYSDRIQALSELSADIRSMFTMVTALVLSYATGFMLKLRRREFGMYLTLGVTCRNIQTLFACETGLLSSLALLVGMELGLVIFRFWLPYYDVMALFALSKEPGISMDEGRKTVEKYSPITGEQDFQLYSSGETTLYSNILGYEEMDFVDLYMPLSQFNRLLIGCGYKPASLEKEYLLVTDVQGICDVDFSGKPVPLNGQTYTWGGSSTEYIRLYRKANAGTLIIGALYVSTVFVCMALAILSVKILSTLEEVGLRVTVWFATAAQDRNFSPDYHRSKDREGCEIHAVT